MRGLIKRVTSLISASTLLLGLLAAVPLTFAFPIAANAAACANNASSGEFAISPSHGNVFYIDSGITPKLDAAYVGYKIQTTQAKTNLWVELTNFTGTQVSLANANDALQQIPVLASGADNAQTAFFLLKATGTESSSDNTHVVKLYQGNPNRGGSLIYDCTFTFTDIKETIKASANKVQEITVPTNNPSLGSLVEVVVIGTTGQPGQGRNPDGDIIWVTPAGFSTWPTSALRLESTTLVLDQDAIFSTTNDQNTYQNQLLVTGIKNLTLGTSSSKLNSGSRYRATYRFRVIGPSASTFKVAPVAQISSGTQYKHSDTNSTATGAFPTIDLRTVSSTMVVTKKIAGSGRVTNTALMTDVATLTTAENHGLSINDVVYISDAGVPYNGTHTITGTTNTTFTYAVTNANIASTALANNGFVFLRGAGNAATVPYEVKVTSSSSTSVDEIVDIPSTGMTYVANSGQLKDVTRTSFTAIPDPVIDASEAAMSPRPKHFTGPFQASSTVSIFLQYKMLIPTTSTAAYSNVLYAKSGNQTVGATTSANSKVEINSTTIGINGVSEVTSAAPPTVSTEAPVTFAATTATLAGIADPNGNAVTIKFQWGTSSNLATSTDATASTASSSSAVPINFSSDLSGLTANTLYYYRAVISYGSPAEVINGEILSFRTNIVGSTAQAITWSTTFPQFNLGTTQSTTVVSNISQSGNDIGEFTSGGVFSNSGLFVELTSSTTSVCTVTTSSNFNNVGDELSVTHTINFLTTGTCTIVASQNGNATYAAAATVTKTFEIVGLYTVTFNGNSSTGGASSVSSVVQTSAGAAVTLATQGTLLRTGFSFGGWNEAANAGGTNRDAGTLYTPTANITLYAKWTAVNYTVTYVDNVDNVEIAVPTDVTNYNNGQTVTVSATEPTRPNFTFGGWTLNSGNTGSVYKTVQNPTFTVGSTNIILYAKWIADGQKSVTFHENYGGTPANISQESPADATLTPNSFTRPGFTFVRWTTAQDGTGTPYDNLAEYPFAGAGTPSTQTLYAQWLINTYTVTYEAGTGGSITGTTSQQINHGSNGSAVTAVPDTGYQFVNWSNGGATSNPRTDSNVTATITYTANFSLLSYTITYDFNYVGGPSNETKSLNHFVNALSNANKPTDPTRSGYTFSGWSESASGSVLSTFTVVGAKSFYSIWVQNAGPGPSPSPTFEPAPAPVAKEKPAIVWNNPNAIKTTTTLSATQLNAVATPTSSNTSPIPGTYIYTPITPTVVTSGTTAVTNITGANNALTGTVKTSTTSGSASDVPVLGQGTALAPGIHKMKVVFIPTDSARYEPVETIVEILVQAETKVDWVEPPPLKKNTPIGSTQLNAVGTAPGVSNNVPGTYKYDIPEGKTFEPGKYPVKVIFTPTDPNYLPSETTVTLTVIADINPLAAPIITPSNTPAAKPITNTTAAANAKIVNVGKGLTTAATDGTQVSIVPIRTFSGKTTVTVSVTDEGETKEIQVPVTVLPLPAVAPTARPNDKGSSTIAWKPSINAIAYEVTVAGKVVCSTAATSCSTSALIGPKSDVKITAKGNDETVSPVAPAKYTAPKKPVTALVVYFDTNKFNLDAKDRADIRAVAKVIIEQGFKNIVINGHTDLRGGVDNQVLSNNRSNSTFEYLRSLVPGLNVSIGAFASTKPAVKGTSAAALASNRRAEVGVF